MDILIPLQAQNLFATWTFNCLWKTLLTYSMVQSPSWEANWFAASQEIPRISRSPNVHYRTQKRPPPVSILGQPNPVHIPTSHLLEIHPNIIHPSTPRSPQWSLSLRFPNQDPIHPLSSPIRATCPAHPILLDFITRKILGEEYKSFSSSLCNITLYYIILCHIISYRIVSYRIASHRIASHHISHHITYLISYHISHHIISYMIWYDIILYYIILYYII